MIVTDDKGNSLEGAIYDKNGSLEEQYTHSYEFDAHGNWIKMVSSKLVSEDGKSYFKPIEATYRTIAYY